MCPPPDLGTAWLSGETTSFSLVASMRVSNPLSFPFLSSLLSLLFYLFSPLSLLHHKRHDTTRHDIIIIVFNTLTASREVRWYNDAYVLSLSDLRWSALGFPPHSPLPRPRSGCQMLLHTAEDVLYIYGGFSKEKVSNSDVYSLLIKPLWRRRERRRGGGKERKRE